MKGIITVVYAALLAILLSLNGCSPLQQAMQNGTNLTPEQIAALDAAGQATVACLQIGGPPPAGAGVVMVVPKTAVGTVKFDASCHPVSEITLGGVK